MMSRLSLIGWFSLLLLLFALQPATAATEPNTIVKETADRILAEVVSMRQELDESPGRIYPLVEHILLPRFDFVRMSRLVLGKHWRRAGAEEKEAFTRAFRELLVRTYTTALLNYSGQEINYLPMRAMADATEVTVNTEVSSAGAPPVPINYKLHLVDDEWKVFDVVIDGISLVSNYRTNFASEIRRRKLSGLIGRLEARNKRGR
ncbi:MAG: ABC transporter substrate-binding protein [Candidatus Sedimenticola sp. (ex Thyasira tokunagai)]